MALKSRNFQRIMRFHRWLGVFLSLHIAVLALTGAILVFRHEFSEAKVPTALVENPVSLQTLIEKSLLQHPDDRVLAVAVDHDDPQRVTLRLGVDGSAKFRGARRLTYDRRNGEIQTEGKVADGFFNFILILHRELFLGTPGKLYVGVLGLVYSFILISGLFVYGPMMKRMSFASLRQHLNPRLWWSDLHKYLGALTFAWSLVIGLSGFLLGWGGPIIKYYQASALQDLLATQRVDADVRNGFVSVDQALDAASAARPGRQFSFVSFPGSEFSTANHYIFVMDGPTPLTEKLSDLIVVDARSGQVDRILMQPWYLQALLLAEPFHFGDYGGLLMKIIWVIFSLLSMILPLSGLRIFLDRFRQNRTGPERWKTMRPQAVVMQKPYRLPVLVMLLSWAGLTVALGVEGIGDLAANLSLAAALTLSFWLLIKNNSAITPDK
jgi:uncharacterized iron-regulated membrane protein